MRYDKDTEVVATTGLRHELGQRVQDDKLGFELVDGGRNLWKLEPANTVEDDNAVGMPHPKPFSVEFQFVWRLLVSNEKCDIRLRRMGIKNSVA